MKKINEISDFIISQHNKGIHFNNLQDPYIPKDEKEAYEAQFLYQRKSTRGEIGGYKIALASKIQQQLCSINNPIAGGIFKNEIYKSPSFIKLKQYQSLGLEFEIAFEISKDILPNTLKNNFFNIKKYVKNAFLCFELS